jgi:hypothetical protein
MWSLLIAHNVPDINILVAWELKDCDNMFIDDGFFNQQDDCMLDQRDKLMSKTNLQGIEEVFQPPVNNPNPKKGWIVRNLHFAVIGKRFSKIECGLFRLQQLCMLLGSRVNPKCMCHPWGASEDFLLTELRWFRKWFPAAVTALVLEAPDDMRSTVSPFKQGLLSRFLSKRVPSKPPNETIFHPRIVKQEEPCESVTCR